MYVCVCASAQPKTLAYIFSSVMGDLLVHTRGTRTEVADSAVVPLDASPAMRVKYHTKSNLENTAVVALCTYVGEQIVEEDRDCVLLAASS